MEPRRLQNRAISKNQLVNLSPSTSWWSLRALHSAGLGGTLTPIPGTASDGNVLTDRARQEGHFHHARFLSHRLPDTVSTVLRLPGNRLQSEDCKGTKRGELRTGRMECYVSCRKLRLQFSFFLFFSSSVILILSFVPNCSTLMLPIIKGHGKNSCFPLFSHPNPFHPPNLSCNAHSFFHIIIHLHSRLHHPSLSNVFFH